jgi:hypothetical protein
MLSVLIVVHDFSDASHGLITFGPRLETSRVSASISPRKDRT